MFRSEKKFVIINDEGKEVECKCLFAFKGDMTPKYYIVYTDNILDEDGNMKIYASSYDQTGKKETLFPIEMDEEWKNIEKILFKIQGKVQGENKERLFSDVIDLDSVEEIDSDDIEIRLNDLSVFEEVTSMNNDKFNDFIVSLRSKLLVGTDRKKDIDEILIEISAYLEREQNADRIDELFRLLNEIGEKNSYYYSRLGMSAYKVKNFLVAERAYCQAIELCSDPDLLIGYKNNLAYLIRRKEIRYPENRSKKEIAVLLRDGIERKDTFSLINMALFWALERSTPDDWEIADHLTSFINQNHIQEALYWWQNVAENEELEGYIVHLLLLRHGKITYSPLGDTVNLFEKVKKEYPQIPDKLKEVITPFEGGKMGELPSFVPWLQDENEW